MNKQKNDSIFVRDFFSFETNSYFPVECAAKYTNNLKIQTENLGKFILCALQNSIKKGEASFNIPLEKLSSEEHFTCTIRTSQKFMEKYFVESYAGKKKGIAKNPLPP